MNVYILRAVDYESSATLDVFATLELAEAAAVACKQWVAKYEAAFPSLEPLDDDYGRRFEAFMRDNPPPYDPLGFITLDSFAIVEFVVKGAP